MAMNTFDALMAEVNQKISEAETAASQANAVAAAASEAANSAGAGAQQATHAAQQAQYAAQAADNAAQDWENLQVAAQTGEAGSSASVTLTKTSAGNRLMFVLPRGNDGAKGAKGDTGRSGVTFTLSGTKLYITTG